MASKGKQITAKSITRKSALRYKSGENDRTSRHSIVYEEKNQSESEIGKFTISQDGLVVSAPKNIKNLVDVFNSGSALFDVQDDVTFKHSVDSYVKIKEELVDSNLKTEQESVVSNVKTKPEPVGSHVTTKPKSVGSHVKTRQESLDSHLNTKPKSLDSCLKSKQESGTSLIKTNQEGSKLPGNVKTNTENDILHIKVSQRVSKLEGPMNNKGTTKHSPPKAPPKPQMHGKINQRQTKTTPKVPPKPVHINVSQMSHDPQQDWIDTEGSSAKFKGNTAVTPPPNLKVYKSDSSRSYDSGISTLSLTDSCDLMMSLRKSMCSSLEDLHEESQLGIVSGDKADILHNYITEGDGTLEEFCEKVHSTSANDVLNGTYVRMDSYQNFKFHKGYVLPDSKPRPSVLHRFNNQDLAHSKPKKSSFERMHEKIKRQTGEHENNNCNSSVSHRMDNSNHDVTADHIYDPVAFGTKDDSFNNQLSVTEIMRRESEKESDRASDFDDGYNDDDDDWYDWSDFDDSDEEDDVTTKAEDETDYHKKDKLYCIVKEIMTTEETYVCKLELLTEAKMKVEVIVKDNTKTFFPFIDSILKLHKEDFLPQLQSRIANWQKERKIGDVMKNFAPYLKMYTDYVKNFNTTLKLVESWMEKSSDFSKAVKNVCEEFASRHTWATNKLGIKDYMLEPVQRVPRYKLLLLDYLKHLPEDCDQTERNHVEEAVKYVSEAAEHFEFTINQTSEFGDLMELDKQIEGPIPILCAARKLIKRGSLNKYCVRTDKIDQRYLFLFSDILLVCKDALMPGSVKYKTRQCLHTEGMQILEGSKLDIKHTFLVKTKQKTVEFVADSEEEKMEWQQKLWSVVGEKVREKLNKKNRYSVRKVKSTMKTMTDLQENKLGKVAPEWVKNKDVTMCMMCAASFTTFIRRHHCRACGNIVCQKCSSHQRTLEYDDFREQHRVCDECFVILSASIPAKKRTNKLRKRSEELCTRTGYLQMSSNEGKSWQRRFCEIHEGGMFYTFKASQDLKPFSVVDLGSCKVVPEVHNQKMALKLATQEDQYLMKEDSSEPDVLLKWKDAFEVAVKDAKSTRFIEEPVSPEDEEVHSTTSYEQIQNSNENTAENNNDITTTNDYEDVEYCPKDKGNISIETDTSDSDNNNDETVTEDRQCDVDKNEIINTSEIPSTDIENENSGGFMIVINESDA